MTMRITADPHTCIGAGQCVLTAPAYFDQDDDGIVVVRDDVPAEAGERLVREAAQLCPSGAIRLLRPARRRS